MESLGQVQKIKKINMFSTEWSSAFEKVLLFR
jgi:hypothetical protein